MIITHGPSPSVHTRSFSRSNLLRLSMVLDPQRSCIIKRQKHRKLLSIIPGVVVQATAFLTIPFLIHSPPKPMRNCFFSSQPKPLCSTIERFCSYYATKVRLCYQRSTVFIRVRTWAKCSLVLYFALNCFARSWKISFLNPVSLFFPSRVACNIPWTKNESLESSHCARSFRGDTIDVWMTRQNWQRVCLMNAFEQ